MLVRVVVYVWLLSVWLWEMFFFCVFIFFLSDYFFFFLVVFLVSVLFFVFVYLICSVLCGVGGVGVLWRWDLSFLHFLGVSVFYCDLVVSVVAYIILWVRG